MNILKCVIYTRVSTDNQAEVEFNSCEAQEAKIKSFIDSQENMSIFKVYSDPGFTGANLNRPALQEMLNDIKEQKINLVIAYKIDRLTRSPKDFYYLIEIFEKYNVDFISVTERFDTSTPSGRLLRNIMLTFAQFERELASERTKDKMLQRAQKGMWNGGLVPFGYKAKDKKLLIDKEKAEIVRSIYEKYITGSSITKLAKIAGISKSRVYNILRNPVYTGKVRYAGKLWQGNHEAIITEEIFEEAQRAHQKVRRVMRFYPSHIFSGLIKCKECGSFMTPVHTNKKHKGKRRQYYYYRCTSTLKKDWDSCSARQISAKRLDRYILDNLERISLDRQYLENLCFSLNHRRGGLPSEALAKDGRIGILESSKTTQDYGVSGNQAGLELSEDTPAISGEIATQTLTIFVQSLKSCPKIQRNLLAQKFIKSIIYSKESIEINLSIPPRQEIKNPSKEPAGIVRKENMAPRAGITSFHSV